MTSVMTFGDLALLEGTPVLFSELDNHFGAGVLSGPSILVAMFYHEAKAACLSQDHERQAEGRELMLAVAKVCRDLWADYFDRDLLLEAAQAAEIEGTAAAFSGDEHRERVLAADWCMRLTGRLYFYQMIEVMAQFDGDMCVVGLKFLLKLAKYNKNSSFEERCWLVALMVLKKHPDSLGRALWACECAPSKEEELSYLLDLQIRWELLDAAKPDQLNRFDARIKELEAAPTP